MYRIYRHCYHSQSRLGCFLNYCGDTAFIRHLIRALRPVDALCSPSRRRGNQLFWTGTIGAIVMSAIGIWFWQPMTQTDWLWMATLCITGVLENWLLIKCYEVAEANTVQPFAYLQMVFASVIGLNVSGETIEQNMLIGSSLVIAAGLLQLKASP